MLLKTWISLKADIAKLEASHTTNQRRILDILWYEFGTNLEVATLSQLPSINESISRRRHSLFGHVKRMDRATPAHQPLHLSDASRQGSEQFGTWRKQSGRPRKCWVKQVTTSTRLSPSDAWNVATWPAWRALRPVDGRAYREEGRTATSEIDLPYK